MDPESRLLLAWVPGQRDGDACKPLIQQVHDRTAGRTEVLITSDEPAPYETAIREVYGIEQPQPKRPGPGRPPKPKKVLPPDPCDATVRKRREKGRVVEVVRTLVFGTLALLQALLGRSSVSTTINTSFVERNHGTDRHQNSRKRRKTNAFSKELGMHRAASSLHGILLQFLLGGSDSAGLRSEGVLEEPDPGDGRGIDRPHLEPRRVGDLFRETRLAFLRHYPQSRLSSQTIFPSAHRLTWATPCMQCNLAYSRGFCKSFFQKIPRACGQILGVLSKVGKLIHGSVPAGRVPMRRHEISDDHWDRIKDFLPGQEGDPGVTAKDNRLFVNAVLWIAKTGAPGATSPNASARGTRCGSGSIAGPRRGSG